MLYIALALEFFIDHGGAPMRFTVSTSSGAANVLAAQRMLRCLLDRAHIQCLMHGRVYVFRDDDTINIDLVVNITPDVVQFEPRLC